MQITTRYPGMRFSILECPWHPHSHPYRHQQEQHQVRENIEEEAIIEQPSKTGKTLDDRNIVEEGCPSIYSVIIEHTVKLFCLSLLG